MHDVQRAEQCKQAESKAVEKLNTSSEEKYSAGGTAASLIAVLRLPTWQLEVHGGCKTNSASSWYRCILTMFSCLYTRYWTPAAAATPFPCTSPC
jgi:hypothetical protein